MIPAGRLAPYWPALDGIRAVAVGLVIAYHLAPAEVDRGGSIGVTMFFTLSGFLITSLLLAESGRTGTVSLRRFYARRALRLLPALLVLVPVVAGYALWSGRDDDTLRAVPSVLLYGGNWVRAVSGFDTLGMFEHAWSLAVEEQFYVVWPLIVLGAGVLAGRRNRAVGVLAAATVGSVASLAWRLVLWNPADPRLSAAQAVNRTDAVADQLLIGCALAAALHLLARRRGDADPPGAISTSARRALHVVGPAALAFLVWIAVARPGGATEANNRLYLTWGSSLFSLAAAALVLTAVAAPRSPLSRLLALPPLVAVGRVSYGLYLWHFPVILAVETELSGSSVTTQRIAALALTALATGASWVLVERPALARKRGIGVAAPAAGHHGAPALRLDPSGAVASSR